MSDTDQCEMSDETLEFKDELQYTVYHVIVPLYFLIGISGNATLLVAFKKQTKSDKAYGYQIFLTLSKTLEIFCSSIFWWGYKWHAGVEGLGHKWYMNNYVLMFFSAHIGCPLSNGFIMTSLLLSVAMAADRVFALTKPYVYKNIKPLKHQILAGAICVFMGLSTSGFEVNRWHVLSGTQESNTTYIVQYNQPYLSQTPIMVLGHLRTAIRFINLALLIILNITLIVIFRRRGKKVGQMAATNDRKGFMRRMAERNLLLLTVYQSCLTALAHLPHSFYFVIAFASVTFDLCYGTIMAAVADACICVADSLDLFVIIGLNQKMRRAVFKILPCCQDQGGPMTTMPMSTMSSQNPLGQRSAYPLVTVG